MFPNGPIECDKCGNIMVRFEKKRGLSSAIATSTSSSYPYSSSLNSTSIIETTQTVDPNYVNQFRPPIRFSDYRCPHCGHTKLIREDTLIGSNKNTG